MILPRVVIAGVKSGEGKTTLSLGIMRALREKGDEVQPFKVGPDYIDPGLHGQAAGRYSHNLDSWMGSPYTVLSVFCKYAVEADISVIEGVMGLFDGSREGGLKGSTAEIAVMLKSPVLLVVDVRGMGKSCVPLVKGYREYLPGLCLEGVILNNARGDFQQRKLPYLLEEELGVKVPGVIPPQEDIGIPERHLGLLPAEENHQLETVLTSVSQVIRQFIKLDELRKIAGTAPAIKSVPKKGYNYEVEVRKSVLEANTSDAPIEVKVEAEKAVEAVVQEELVSPAASQEDAPVKIGVAMDRAFHFYYRDSLEYLQELGAELYYFSPLKDEGLPPVNGLYLGGGFPEMFLEELSGNISLQKEIYRAGTENMPILAECGGFIYLAENIVDFKGKPYRGVGLIPASMEMTSKLQALGYVRATAIKDTLLAEQGKTLRGHEFHYAKLTWNHAASIPHAFTLVGGRGSNHRYEGYTRGNLLASYLHLHLRFNPASAIKFLEACRIFQEKSVKKEKRV